jgi:hypothetical protein
VWCNGSRIPVVQCQWETLYVGSFQLEIRGYITTCVVLAMNIITVFRRSHSHCCVHRTFIKIAEDKRGLLCSPEVGVYIHPPWPESASESRLLAKLVPTFADRGCHVVSMTDPYGRILGSLGRSRYFFFQVAPQLYSRGWVDPVPDPLLLRKSSSAGNRTKISGSVARDSDH